MIDYSIRQIPAYVTHEWVLKKHYAHSLPPITYAFGLYDSCNILQGVCTFGMPAASQLQDICTGYKTLELSRLVTNENLKTNATSYFVSHALGLLPKPCVVVSYSDTSMGHHGYIYQATNFIYTGLGAGSSEWAIKGLDDLNYRTINDSCGRYEDHPGVKRSDLLKAKWGDALYKKKNPLKHRYIFLCASQLEKRKMLRLLRYKPLPYPKGDNQRYDASYEPTNQGLLL